MAQLQDTGMNLVLSSDAKPRLKWTSNLHQRFVRAVDQLGGPEKATPKSLMRVMGIHGLTLYHLKSHLQQKYRSVRSQPSGFSNRNKLRDDEGNQRRNFADTMCNEAPEQINENSPVAEALQVQMEVQKKLHEQIEVQKHLQLRIEAQGMYLQSVLKKAQETLSGYISCSIEVENAKDQLAQLVSLVDSTCPSSPFSVLTENNLSVLKDARHKLSGHNSVESSLASSESSGRNEDTQPKLCAKSNKGKRNSVENSESEYQVSNRKRSKITIDEESSSDKSRAKSSDEQVQRLRALGDIDLNCDTKIDFDLGPGSIDLNFTGVNETIGTE